MKTINAQVTDTDRRPRGEMRMQVDLDKTGPSLVEHDGRAYCSTYKAGSSRETGLELR